MGMNKNDQDFLFLRVLVKAEKDNRWEKHMRGRVPGLRVGGPATMGGRREQRRGGEECRSRVTRDTCGWSAPGTTQRGRQRVKGGMRRATGERVPGLRDGGVSRDEREKGGGREKQRW